MKYRNLGQWGIKVSVVSLGTWLTHGGSVDVTDTVRCVHQAYDAGVNFFDTANEYQQGRAEEVLGKALTDLDRDGYLVGTKVFQPMGEGPLRRGLSRKHIVSQVEGSLRRLGLDYIDLYQCHRFDSQVPLEETAKTMSDLVQAGKVLYWGVSEWPAEQLSEVVSLCRSADWAVPVSDQVQYSALWRTIERDVTPACRAAGLGMLAWSPLAMGVLTGKYLPGKAPLEGRGSSDNAWFLERYLRTGALEAVQEFNKVARDAGYTGAQLALAWCLQEEQMTSAIVGVTSPAQLSENLARVDDALDPDLYDRVGSILASVATL